MAPSEHRLVKGVSALFGRRGVDDGIMSGLSHESIDDGNHIPLFQATGAGELQVMTVGR